MYGGLKSLQSWEGALLPWWGDWTQSLHKKAILVLWMQFSFLRFKVKEEPLTYTGITTQCWKAVSPENLLPSTETEMHFLSSCGCFSCGLLRWWKEKLQFWIRHERHVVVASQIRLYSCYRVSQSLYNWLWILALVIWPKHKKLQWMHQLYIYFQTSGIFSSSLKIFVPRKVQIAKIWGSCH